MLDSSTYPFFIPLDFNLARTGKVYSVPEGREKYEKRRFDGGEAPLFVSSI
jgi:hypothetical protein